MKNGWQTKTLGDLCVLTSGGTPSKNNQRFWVGNVPFVSARDLKSDRIETALLHISREAVERSATKVAPVGSLLMLVRGMGLANGIQVGEVTAPVAFNQDIRALLPTLDSVLPRFLLLALRNSFMNGEGGRVLSSAAHGTLKIDTDVLRQIAILFPPLPEQRRIVAILDEAFDHIATAKANAEKNLKNARALFESYIRTVLTQRGDGWVDRSVSEVAESISTGPFGTMLHKSDYISDGIPLVNPMNIVDSRIVPSRKMMVSEETRDRLASYVLKVGDVVIARRGELGRCAWVSSREAGWLCGTGSFFVRLTAAVDGEFFVALFGSEQFRSQLDSAAVGTTMSSLNHGILNDLILPVPPLGQQRQIMARARALSSETQSLESIYQKKLAALGALKKSLLHQAFSGTL